METAVAEKLAATNEEAFNFASYMKERAQLVNEALDKSVPLQYPEIINESMRQASEALTGHNTSSCHGKALDWRAPGCSCPFHHEAVTSLAGEGQSRGCQSPFFTA